MSEPRIENAIIEAVKLGTEDHGIFTCYVFVKGDCTCGGFGGYALDSYSEGLKRRVGTAYGLEFIKGILDTLEKENWENLPGTPVRIETTGIGGRITKLGHFLKNKWFDPDHVRREAV